MEPFANTKAFLKVIEETSRLNGGKLISRLWLKAGPDMCFSGDTSYYMEAIIKGTAARGAEIYISRGAEAGRCRCCGMVFGEMEGNCPGCGGAVERISLDRSFIVDKVELESI